eukprot:8842541-Heterocapsa_arctica.AAC.1
MVKRTKALALAVREKMTIIKTAGQSRPTYGAATDLFTQAEIKSLRTNFFEALWPNKYTRCKVTGLMLADKGELEPKLSIFKKVVVNWLRQIGGGISEETYERWDQYAVYTGNSRGPINYFRREMKELGWVNNSPTNITDHNNITREISEWPSV